MIIGFLLVAATLFASALLGTTFGAFSGWVVSLTAFGDWIKHVLGNPSYSLAELGALLGFVGAFFRSYTSLARPHQLRSRSRNIDHDLDRRLSVGRLNRLCDDDRLPWPDGGRDDDQRIREPLISDDDLLKRRGERG